MIVQYLAHGEKGRNALQKGVEWILASVDENDINEGENVPLINQHSNNL